MELALQPTSRTGNADGLGADRGFVLLEIVCVLAIIALLAAILLPIFPRATSRSRLEGYAFEAAALLKADRFAAIRRHTQVRTQINAPNRVIGSGVNGYQIRLPNDVAVNALLAARCGGQRSDLSIIFFPSGASCGGVIELSRPGMIFHVRVNWLTGGD